MRKNPFPFVRQAFLFGLLISLIGMINEPILTAAPTNTVYQPTWASVDQHNPAPEWFKDAKFGI
jgi:alpha-L-fucosidase